MSDKPIQPGVQLDAAQSNRQAGDEHEPADSRKAQAQQGSQAWAPSAPGSQQAHQTHQAYVSAPPQQGRPQPYAAYSGAPQAQQAYAATYQQAHAPHAYAAQQGYAPQANAAAYQQAYAPQAYAAQQGLAPQAHAVAYQQAYAPQAYPAAQQQGYAPQPSAATYQQGYAPQAFAQPQHAAGAVAQYQAPLLGQAGQKQLFHDPTGKYKIVMQGAFVAGGAMVSMSENVDLVAKLDGGLGAALCRSCCAGESGFFSYFHLREGTRGDVLLAPATPGDVVMLHLTGREEWRIQKGSYLASDDSVSVGTAFQGLAQGCCSGEGFIILKASGVGRLLLNSFGSIVRYDLQPGEVRRIDNGFLVAWHSSMQYTIGLASKSIVASILSGEAVVTKFVGPGTVYAQTRSLAALALSVAPFIPAKQQSKKDSSLDNPLGIASMLGAFR